MLVIRSCVFVGLLALFASCRAAEPATDEIFLQELHDPMPIGGEARSNDVRSIAVEPNGAAWAATGAGIFVRRSGDTAWTRPVGSDVAKGPAYRALAHEGRVWIGAWNGLFCFDGARCDHIAGVDGPISALCADGVRILAAGPEGWWRVNASQAERQALPCSRGVRSMHVDRSGRAWFGTGLGIIVLDNGKKTQLLNGSEPWSTDVKGLATAQDGAVWSVGLGGAIRWESSKLAAAFGVGSEIPSIDAQCVAIGPDARVWIGTAHGVARFSAGSWSLRHSRRWLLDDDVRDIAFGPDGAAWIATAAGVSVIRQRELTLAAKAEHFHAACAARHVREPGLVEKCRLRAPGDLTTWGPYDDDNDGQYTSMYLAMQSLRFAVTKDPKVREAAAHAFRALRFLQTVTGTPSFVARTVIPSTWTTMADPNETISAEEWAERRAREPREKRVEKHWRPSADGKWLWKGDTSSDEITGHMYGYLIYHDLCADDAEKKIVAEHVARIVDGIIADGFVLKDTDGAHTRWGVWAPERLNDDPDWILERGINSVEILSYLKLAGHVTGDAKYEADYQRLLNQHGYRQNLQLAKSMNPAWRTHIDDELLALAFPALLTHEKDPELRALYLSVMEAWYATVKEERSPYFDFVHAGLGGKSSDLTPTLDFLRDAPLDLVRWAVDNTKRQDLQVVRLPELEHVQTSRLPPPSERGVIRWDDNPWVAVQGDGGQTESDGVYWLLPYWMGRYYGFIR